MLEHGEPGFGRGDADLNEFDFMNAVFGRHVSPVVVCRHDGPEAIASILDSACQVRAAVTLCCAHAEQPLFGRFDRLAGDQVHVMIDQDEKFGALAKKLCTAIFTHGDRQCMFFSTASSNAATGPHLRLRLPKAIDEVEARSNKRIRSAALEEVHAKLLTPSEFDAVRVVDLGRGGIDLDLWGFAGELCVGDEVQLHLRMKDASARTSAALRWRHGSRHGFCFAHNHGRSYVHVPQDLEQLISKVEAASRGCAA